MNMIRKCKTKHKRQKTSIKQQQDRQLYTRKKGGMDTQSPRTDDESSIPDSSYSNTQQWLRLSKQQGTPPPQILDDPDELPPPANGGTGTDLDVLVSVPSRRRYCGKI